MMNLKKLSNEINGMKEQMKIKSEMLFKELFKKKLDKWLIMDKDGNIVGYEVDDISEDDDQDFLALQKAINELMEILTWDLLDWEVFPYKEDDIFLERGGMKICIKNELLNIDSFLENFFEIR